MFQPTFRTLKSDIVAIFDRWSEQPEHGQVLLLQVEHLAADHLPVLAHDQQVDALENLEDPAHGWGLDRFADLIEARFLRSRPAFARSLRSARA